MVHHLILYRLRSTPSYILSNPGPYSRRMSGHNLDNRTLEKHTSEQSYLEEFLKVPIPCK